MIKTAYYSLRTNVPAGAIPIVRVAPSGDLGLSPADHAAFMAGDIDLVAPVGDAVAAEVIRVLNLNRGAA